jgi:hypothetical protein
VLSYLLSVGGDLSVRSDDDDACTALHCAAAGGSAQAAEAIKTLLLFGAERDARDASGRRAADLLPVRDPVAERLLGATPPPSVGAGACCGGLYLGGPAAKGNLSSINLSDLDSEAFATDAFKMYEFKVSPTGCSRPVPCISPHVPALPGAHAPARAHPTATRGSNATISPLPLPGPTLHQDARARLDGVPVHAPGREGAAARPAAVRVLRHGMPRLPQGQLPARRRV